MNIPVKTANADNFTMKYFTFGKGEKTFVILPGLSVQSVMNSSQLIADAYSIMADEFTVYVFDRRNELPETYSVYDMAEDTAKIFCALGLKDVYLFGASQGGMMALTIAANHPELVKKLMLGSSCAYVTDKQYKTISEWIDLAKKRERVRLNLTMGESLYPKELFEKFKNTLEAMGEGITDGELARFIRLAEGAQGFDVRNRIGEIQCPVLSLGVSDDTVLPNAAEELETLFKGKADFESHMYTGLGHAAFDTAPDYKERLLKFCIE